MAAVASTVAPYGPVGASSFLAVALLGVGLSAVGAARAPRGRRRVWTLLALGQAAYFTGDVCWVVYDHVLGIEPSPSAADVFYLSRYLLVAAGLLVLLRERRHGRDRAAILDACIVTTGFGVLATVFLVLPAAEHGGSSPVEQVVAGAYPLADVLLLGVFIRLLTSGGTARSTSFWALTAGLVTILVVDVLYTLSVTAKLDYPAWLDGGWLLTYLLVGFAAAHPSSVLPPAPREDAPERMSRARVALLGVAMALAPVTGEIAEVTGYGRTSHVVFIGALVGTGLVVLRLWDLLGSLERNAAQLAAVARVDGLTGVPNRRSWDEELSWACAAAGQDHQPLTVAVLDLDHFKAYNDSHGHLRGDLVLKESAEAWQAALDGRGLLARFGGEEFTVLLPDTGLDAAAPLLDRLRASTTAGQTVSIGVAVWDSAEDPAAVVARADQALYHAKRAGRDRIAVHDGTAARELRAPRTTGVESLLSTVFQPIVCLSTGEPVAFEALSRFSNGNPQEVFDRALLHGTQATLEAAALRSALAAWRGTLPVALNLTGATICSPEVAAALSGDLSQVVIELTESDSAASSTAAREVLADLRARGARIAVDDFGVGFSNIERVALIRPDLLKLDMSLVRGIDRNPMLRAVVRGCTAAAEEAGALVCAEGIETAGELDTLVELGVPLGQGYLLGRPQPFAHYEGVTDNGSAVPLDLFRSAAAGRPSTV